MTVSRYSRVIPPAEAGIEYAASLDATAAEWLWRLQENTKMPNSAVARKMRVTPKHVAAILEGPATLNDLAQMFHAMGYKLHIHTEDLKTGEKAMQPPQSAAKTTKSRR